MKNPWKKLISEYKYENAWIRLREDKVLRPDGKEGIYGVIEKVHTYSVFVVLLNEKKEVLLIHNYRYPVDSDSWEIIGGHADQNTLLDSAKKEVREESGYNADKWTELGQYYEIPGLSDARGNIYLAEELEWVGGDEMDEEGIAGYKFVPLEEVWEMIGNNEIKDAPTIVAISKVSKYLGFNLS